MNERLPHWLKVKLPETEKSKDVRKLIQKFSLKTICSHAKCPNRGECWEKKTATFLILGDICTRNCLYCNVRAGKPKELCSNEIEKVVESINILQLSYAVVTSVTRDDIEDGGISFFVELLQKAKEKIPHCKIEILVPDFKGEFQNIVKIIDENPFVIGHNIEIVRTLFPSIRPQGNYERSLKLLKHIKNITKQQVTKSGLMIGIGETKEEIIETLNDLKKADVDIVTIGQYLQPRKDLAEVKKYYTPEEFVEIKIIAEKMHFKKVFSGPLVRSSYHAHESLKIESSR